MGRYPDQAVKSRGTGTSGDLRRQPGGPPITTAVSAPEPGTEPVASTVRDGWALIGRQMLAQRWGLLAGAAAGLVWTAAKVSVPKLVELAIDQGIEPGDQDAVVRYAWAIAGVALVAAAFTGLRRYSAFREARQAEAVLRDRLFAHLQRLHFAYHDGQQTGQLMSRANNDLQQIQNAVVLVPTPSIDLARKLVSST